MSNNGLHHYNIRRPKSSLTDILERNVVKLIMRARICRYATTTRVDRNCHKANNRATGCTCHKVPDLLILRLSIEGTSCKFTKWIKLTCLKVIPNHKWQWERREQRHRENDRNCHWTIDRQNIRHGLAIPQPHTCNSQTDWPQCHKTNTYIITMSLNL